MRLEQYAPPSDQDEALFDRARTVQEAVRRPRAARALYTAYVRRFPAGRHIQEVRRRLETLGGPAPPEPDTDGTVSDEPMQVEPAQVEPAQVEPERDAPLDAR
ncbi:MAG: hypothetical protein ACK6CU_11230 [Deltaproteobacteria bacterium]